MTRSDPRRIRIAYEPLASRQARRRSATSSSTRRETDRPAETLLGGAQAVGDGLLVDPERGRGGGGVVLGGEVGGDRLADPLRDVDSSSIPRSSWATKARASAGCRWRGPRPRHLRRGRPCARVAEADPAGAQSLAVGGAEPGSPTPSSPTAMPAFDGARSACSFRSSAGSSGRAPLNQPHQLWLRTPTSSIGRPRSVPELRAISSPPSPQVMKPRWYWSRSRSSWESASGVALQQPAIAWKRRCSPTAHGPFELHLVGVGDVAGDLAADNGRSTRSRGAAGPGASRIRDLLLDQVQPGLPEGHLQAR